MEHLYITGRGGRGWTRVRSQNGETTYENGFGVSVYTYLQLAILPISVYARKTSNHSKTRMGLFLGV